MSCLHFQPLILSVHNISKSQFLPFISSADDGFYRQKTVQLQKFALWLRAVVCLTIMHLGFFFFLFTPQMPHADLVSIPAPLPTPTHFFFFPYCHFFFMQSPLIMFSSAIHKTITEQRIVNMWPFVEKLKKFFFFYIFFFQGKAIISRTH